LCYSRETHPPSSDSHGCLTLHFAKNRNEKRAKALKTTLSTAVFRFIYSNGIQEQKGRAKKVLDASEHKRSLCYLPARILWYIFCMREFTLYEEDNGIWIAECKELPGYRATGKTKEEALQKVQHALLLYHPCRCED
jgi:predicted RNase H-like HicB family nuclease